MLGLRNSLEQLKVSAISTLDDFLVDSSVNLIRSCGSVRYSIISRNYLFVAMWCISIPLQLEPEYHSIP